MKMPDHIDAIMFAPCGINCLVCYKHCNSKKPCAGCRSDDTGKPRHCLTCKIKSCAADQGLEYCFDCERFPCKLIKNLNKSYTKRYCWDLVMCGTDAKEDGVDVYLQRDRNYWTCTRCGGVISLHDAECSDCKTKVEGRYHADHKRQD